MDPLESARDEALKSLLGSACFDVDTVPELQRKALLAWIRSNVSPSATFGDFWQLLEIAIQSNLDGGSDGEALQSARAAALLGFLKDVTYETKTLGEPAERVGDIKTQTKETIEQRGLDYSSGVMRKALLLPHSSFDVPENIRRKSPLVRELSAHVGAALDAAIAVDLVEENGPAAIARDEFSKSLSESSSAETPEEAGDGSDTRPILRLSESIADVKLSTSRRGRSRASEWWSGFKILRTVPAWLAGVIIVAIAGVGALYFFSQKGAGVDEVQSITELSVEAVPPTIKWSNARFWIPLGVDLTTFPSGSVDCTADAIRQWLVDNGFYQGPLTLVARNVSPDSSFWLSDLTSSGEGSAPVDGYIMECQNGSGGMGPGETTQLALEAVPGGVAVFENRDPNYFSWKVDAGSRLIADVYMSGNRDFSGSLSMTAEDSAGREQQVEVTDPSGAAFLVTHHGSGRDPFVKITIDAQRNQLMAKNEDMPLQEVACAPAECQKIVEAFWARR